MFIFIKQKNGPFFSYYSLFIARRSFLFVFLQYNRCGMMCCVVCDKQQRFEKRKMIETIIEWFRNITFLQIIDFVGTFAFAISGIRLASAKRFDWFGAYVVGVVTAAVVGYLCIRLLKMIADKGKFGFFAYYCWAIGVLTLVMNAIK